MDAEIERRIHSNDHQGALRVLAETYGAPLGRFCQASLGSRDEAADALQDTLVAALKAMANYRGDHGVRAWVFGIARHQCADVIRKRARRRSVWSRLFGAGDLAATPAPPSEAADARLALERALLNISVTQREAVLLRYQQGMDATEVADVLGISHAAARKRISIGMQALRTALDPFPRIAPSATALGQQPTDEAHNDDSHLDDHSLRTIEDPARLRP